MQSARNLSPTIIHLTDPLVAMSPTNATSFGELGLKASCRSLTNGPIGVEFRPSAARLL